MPILTHVGLLTDDKISDAARQSFVDLVNVLLLNGSDNWFGGAAAAPPAASFGGNSFFGKQFDIQPIEKHRETFPVWHKVFIDTMYEGVANALNVDGRAPLLPILDPTVTFAPLNLKLKSLTIPDFAIGMALPPPAQIEYFFDVSPDDLLLLTPQIPDLLAKLPVGPPDIPMPPPLPGLPSFAIPPYGLIIPIPFPPAIPFVIPPIPPIPGIPNFLPLPFPVMGFLLCAIVKALPAIFAILIAKSIAGELITSLKDGPPGLIAFVAIVVIDAILSCLGINLKNVLTFLAGFLVFIEKLVLIIVTVLIGLIFGEGLLVQLVATAIGLV